MVLLVAFLESSPSLGKYDRVVPQVNCDLSEEGQRIKVRAVSTLRDTSGR